MTPIDSSAEYYRMRQSLELALASTAAPGVRRDYHMSTAKRFAELARKSAGIARGQV